MKKKYTNTIITLLLIYTSIGLSAEEKKEQEKTSEDIKIEFFVDEKIKEKKATEGHGTIIISADRTKKSTADIPLAASVVDKEQIEEKSYTSMADLLNDATGFSQVYDYHSPLILRGMTGKKMLMLRNGHPRFSSLPGGFMGQNVNIYDIERIEVIRGPGSVIYGSGAMAGIINIIEKDPFEKKGLHFKAGTSYALNSNAVMTVGQAQWSNDTCALMTSGRFRKADDMHYGGGDTAINSHHQDGDFSLRAGYRVSDKHQLSFNSSLHFGGPWGKPYMFNLKEQILVVNDNDNSHHFSLGYQGEKIGLFRDIICSVFYDYETRDYHKKKTNMNLSIVNVDEITCYEDHVGGGYFLGTIPLGKHLLSIGGNGYIFRIWSPGKTIDYYNGTESTFPGADASGTASIGVFVQDNWKITKSFALIGGVRYDFASVAEGEKSTGANGSSERRHAASGNAGMIYKVHRNGSLTFNAGRAFRMPNSMDMFTERATCAGTLVPNPGLKPEYSWNFDLGYRGNIKGFHWDVAVFSNFYNDLIVKIPNPEDNSEDIMSNEEQARVIGGEVLLFYKLKKFIQEGMSLKPGVSLAYYRGDSFTGKGSPWKIWDSATALTGIPPVKCKAFIRYMYMSDLLNCFFELETDTSFSKGRMPDELSESPWNNENVKAYTLLNLTTGIKIFNKLGLEEIKINISLHNLLDLKYYPFGSHINGKGRDFKVFISAQY